MSSLDARSTAALVVTRVVTGGESLTAAWPAQRAGLADARDRALAQELIYGTLRWWPRLDLLVSALVPRPLKRRDADILALLAVGIYQLGYLRVPAHAAVSTTVAACQSLNKSWATGLVNGVLRNYQRRHEHLAAELESSELFRYAHPVWLIDAIKSDWPDHWPAILDANNARPPMTLRVNRCRIDWERYRALLTEQGIAATPLSYAPDGLTLDSPTDARTLPGFADGWVSVQDEAAQLSVPLLDLQPGQRVLDACAAPGGKTAYLLERHPDLETVVAVDHDSERLARVRENLARLGLQATTITGDAGEPQRWFDGQGFDRILLDVPCSATGVIRRHPDIKLLRRPGDIAQLAAAQAKILSRVWPLLAKGGKLLYVTCSILNAENGDQIEAFLQQHSDARLLDLDAPWAASPRVGRQVLPGHHNMDGFYYALLAKAA